MTDNIKMPPMPKPHTPPVFATAANTPSVKAGYELGGYEKTPPLFDEYQLEAFAREAVRLNAQAEPDAPTWEQVQKAWYAIGADVAGLDWSAFVRKVSAAPAAPQPAQQPLTDRQTGMCPSPLGCERHGCHGACLPTYEQAHGIGVKP